MRINAENNIGQTEISFFPRRDIQGNKHADQNVQPESGQQVDKKSEKYKKLSPMVDLIERYCDITLSMKLDWKKLEYWGKDSILVPSKSINDPNLVIVGPETLKENRNRLPANGMVLNANPNEKTNLYIHGDYEYWRKSVASGNTLGTLRYRTGNDFLTVNDAIGILIAGTTKRLIGKN